MSLDGEYAATIDRIVEGIAVVLIEADDRTVDERHIPVEELSNDVSEGDRFRLTFDDGSLARIDPRPDETAERRTRFRERFERLSRRLGEHNEGEAEKNGEADERDSEGRDEGADGNEEEAADRR